MTAKSVIERVKDCLGLGDTCARAAREQGRGVVVMRAHDGGKDDV
jgi:hypothetical protein